MKNERYKTMKKNLLKQLCSYAVAIMMIAITSYVASAEPVVVRTNYTVTTALGPSFNLSDNSTCYKQSNATIKTEDHTLTVDCMASNNIFKEIIFARDLQAVCSSDSLLREVLNTTKEALDATRNQTKEILDYNNKTKDFPFRFAEIYGKNTELSLSVENCNSQLSTEKSKTENLTKENEMLKNSNVNLTDAKKTVENSLSNCQVQLGTANAQINEAKDELEKEKGGKNGHYIIGAIVGGGVIYYFTRKKTGETDVSKEFGPDDL